MATFQLSVVAPDRTVYEDVVVSCIVPGVAGYLGVMANHESMLVALKPGIIEYEDTNRQRMFVSIAGGFAEISESKVIVLADDAMHSSEIDLAEAEASLEEARRALRGESSSMSTAEATLEIDRAMARIRAAKRKN